jgi:hypothetical protein
LHHTNQQNLRGAFFFGKGPSGSKSAKTAPSLKAAKPLMLDPTFDTTASSIATARKNRRIHWRCRSPFHLSLPE